MVKSYERKGKRKAKTSPIASGSSKDNQEAVPADNEGRSKKKTRKTHSWLCITMLPDRGRDHLRRKSSPN
jgi:hypothetical protein